jgi:chromosome segregation ATPase
MGVLKILGLIPASRLASVAERLRKSESRVETLSKKLEEVQTESRAWRSKVDEAQKRVKELEGEVSREAQRFQKAKAEIEKEAARDKKKTVDADALDAHLDEADHDLTVARNHLMAIEVKLDILEGAATVLDGRTRTLFAVLSPDGSLTSTASRQ